MPKRKEPEPSSPAKNMEQSGARQPREPPRIAILALEAPNISPSRSLRGRGRGRSGRGGRSGGDTISGRGGRSGGDTMPGRGGRSGGESISSRGGRSKRGRGLRLPTDEQGKLYLKEKGREIVGIELATVSMRRESSSTSRNNSVALTPENNVADQGLPPSNPAMMIRQREADEVEAFANAPAPEPKASTQADPSIEIAGSRESDNAKLSLKSLEPAD